MKFQFGVQKEFLTMITIGTTNQNAQYNGEPFLTE